MEIKALFKRLLFRLHIIDHKWEFLVILSWMLFFPVKDSYFYFLTTAGLLGFFTIRNILSMKTFGLSGFNIALSAACLLFILSVFFSSYPGNSLLFLSDILLIASYFMVYFHDRTREEGLFTLVGYIVSLFSLLTVINYIFPFMGGDRRFVFFASAIHEGIIAGVGVLIFLHLILTNNEKTRQRIFWPLMFLNMVAVFVSQSKAAYIGTVLFALLLLMKTMKKWLPFLLLGVLLTFIIPNPIQTMFHRSLYKDPYAADRLNIWKMCGRIIADYPLTGTGLDNFRKVSPRYNFKQTQGPANYFKVPRNTHNDVLKLLSETGALGLLVLLFVGWFLVRKIFTPPLLDIKKILLLYLLFQAMLFNILFNTFFFFLFLFLLKSLLEEAVTFKSFSTPFKFAMTSFVVILFAAGYYLPWVSDTLVRRADGNNPMESYRLLQKASVFNPMNAAIPYLKALTLYRHFRSSTQLEAFYAALDHVREARGMDNNYIDAYLLEADLYLAFLEKNVRYPGMDREIIGALEIGETCAPFNPFIKMIKAKVYMAFQMPQKARAAAEQAFILEPRFAEAVYFLNRHFNYFQDNEFVLKLKDIQKVNAEVQPRPGQYLYRLFNVPGIETPR